MVVVKCPTYYPGDIRILVQKNIPELSHLTDVVVFSTDESAKRPVPHEIHESDLDGDEYFVCWDQDLVPKAEMKPMNPTKREKVPLQLRVESQAPRLLNLPRNHKMLYKPTFLISF